MKNFRLKSISFLCLFGMFIILFSCQNDDTTNSSEQEELNSIKLIHDGANNGNTTFYFLPPLVNNPNVSGVFDQTLNPSVVISELNNSQTIAPPLVVFSPTLSLEDEHYKVNWHTDDFELSSEVTYRIEVLVEDILIGYADVDVVGSGKELKNVNTNEYIALLDGRTLPIKFRIEEGALDNNDLDEDGFLSAVDCDDNDPAINPGATEIVYNGIDDDCDPGTLDDDLDQDGFLNVDDCNDNDPSINTSAEEVCDNGIDDDCDGDIDEDCIVLPDPIAYYPFNGNANDETGNGYDGIVNNAVLTEDRLGNSNSAYSFDDVGNKRISLGTAINPANMVNLTVSAWINLEASAVPCCDGDSQTILGQGSGTGSSSRYPFWFFFTYNGRYVIKRNAPSLETDTNIYPEDSNWHFVTATVEGVSAKLYFDGVEIKSATYTNPAGGTNYPLSIGNLGDTQGTYGNTFNGDIDEVRIYNVALSAAEIEALYNLE